MKKEPKIKLTVRSMEPTDKNYLKGMYIAFRKGKPNDYLFRNYDLGSLLSKVAKEGYRTR
jgi:hypothetical protein